MKKNLDILSLLMAVVYGTLVLVAVPMHHHALNYIDTIQYQSTESHDSVDCDVCTFASQSLKISTCSESCLTISCNSEKSLPAESFKEFSLLFIKEYPRRGPPALLA